jgi:hypothetical protein
MPRLTSETIGGGDQSWLGSAHGISNCRTGTVDISAFTALTHYPDGYLPSGLALDVSDESAMVPWTGGATERLGFLFTDQTVDLNNLDDFAAPVYRHGTIVVANLPVAMTGGTPADGAFVFIDTTEGS